MKRVSKGVSRTEANGHWSIVDVFYNQPRLYYSADSFSFDNIFMNVDFEMESKWNGRGGFENLMYSITVNDSFLLRKKLDYFELSHLNGNPVDLRSRLLIGTYNKVIVRNRDDEIVINDSLYFQRDIQSRLDTVANKLIVRWSPDPNAQAPLRVTVAAKQHSSLYVRPKKYYRSYYIPDKSGQFKIDLSGIPEWATSRTEDYSFSLSLSRQQYEKVNWPKHFRKLELISMKIERHFLNPLDDSNVASKCQ
ncbi:MAG: hypothetical protein Salg2KO_04830 [Salibacteraceae bacterium]